MLRKRLYTPNQYKKLYIIAKTKKTIFFTYPFWKDSVETVLLNKERPNEWEKIHKYLGNNKFINNKKAREITGIIQMDKMSKLFKKWFKQGLIIRIPHNQNIKKNVKYKLVN